MSSSSSSSSSSLSLSSLPAAAAASETGSGSGRGAAAAETKDPTTDPAWFAAPRTIDSAWDLAKIAHHQTLPEYDPATRSFVWRRDESGATEICGSIATWQQSCPRVEVSVWRVDRAIGRPIMCYRSSASWGSSCEVELWSPDSASSGGVVATDAKARTRTMVYQSEQLVYVIDKNGLEWPPIERKLLIDDACGLMPPAPTKSSGSAERDLADAELERERQARLGFRKIARTMRDSGWTAEFIRKAPVAAHASSSAPPSPSSTATARISSVMWSRADTSTRTEQRVPASICATNETDLFAPETTDAPSSPPSPSKKVAPSPSSPPPSSSSSLSSLSLPLPRADPVHGLSAEGIAEGRRLLRLLHGSM